MSIPKLHHYVPRFYLKNFTENNSFWVWNKENSSMFPGNPNGVAAENNFYKVPEFIGTETNPLFLEYNLAQLEGKVAKIYSEWFSQLENLKPMEDVQINDENRSLVSYFIALQFFRTAEQREILAIFAEESDSYKEPLDKNEVVNLHSHFLCTSEVITTVTDRIEKSIWLFARNDTSIPFWSSDNPVLFKTGDNKMWLKGPGILSKGSYVVYPLSTKYLLYCKEPTFWDDIKIMNNKLSPIPLNNEMIEHENAGQVFSAKRFVISNNNNFEFANQFVKTIGTDKYKPENYPVCFG